MSGDRLTPDEEAQLSGLFLYKALADRLIRRILEATTGDDLDVELRLVRLIADRASALSRLETAERALWFEHYRDVYPEAAVDHGDCEACRLLAALRGK